MVPSQCSQNVDHPSEKCFVILPPSPPLGAAVPQTGENLGQVPGLFWSLSDNKKSPVTLGPRSSLISVTTMSSSLPADSG